jgi:hypothetical protein
LASPMLTTPRKREPPSAAPSGTLMSLKTTPSMISAAPKLGWDKRAWALGLILGNLCAIVGAWAGYPPIERALDQAFPIYLLKMHGGQFISTVFHVFCVVILPIAITALARRRTFLWGLLPLALFIFWLRAEGLVANGWTDLTSGFWLSFPDMGLLLLMTSGPVSLYRYSRVRAHRKDQAALDAYRAQQEAASIPQLGVWPPPPEYNKSI